MPEWLSLIITHLSWPAAFVMVAFIIGIVTVINGPRRDDEGK